MSEPGLPSFITELFEFPFFILDRYYPECREELEREFLRHGLGQTDNESTRQLAAAWDRFDSVECGSKRDSGCEPKSLPVHDSGYNAGHDSKNDTKEDSQPEDTREVTREDIREETRRTMDEFSKKLERFQYKLDGHRQWLADFKRRNENIGITKETVDLPKGPDPEPVEKIVDCPKERDPEPVEIVQMVPEPPKSCTPEKSDRKRSHWLRKIFCMAAADVSSDEEN